MQQILYIEIAGQIWKLFEDGRLQLLAVGETVPEGVEVVTMPTEGTEDNTAEPGTDDNPETLLTGAQSSGSSLNSSTPSSTNNSAGGSVAAGIFGSISRDGEEVLAQSGFQTFGAAPVSVPDSPIEAGGPAILSDKAAITIQINDDDNLEDNYVNRFENDAVGFFGTTVDIDDDDIVELVLVDSEGRVFNLETTVLADGWLLPDQDLSAVAEGPFTVTATVRDFYGNFVTASAESIKDTLAEGVDINAEAGADNLIDIFEAPAVNISGQFEQVQAGAAVTVQVTDVAGSSLSFETLLQADGSWQVVEDLSQLTEGILLVRADTIDLAGNPAQIAFDLELSLSPTISLLNIDKDGQFDDDIYNQFESVDQRYFGELFNVDDGQTVTLSISDSQGTVITATTLSSNHQWSIDGVDTSSLVDGALAISVAVTNFAGDMANAAIARGIDQTAEISAEFVDPNNDAVLNALEAMAATLQGSSVDIENGQPVFINVGDSGGASIDAVGQIGLDGLWIANNINLTSATGSLLFLTLSATDAAGNPATATASIAYDPLAVVDDIAFDNVDGDQDQLFNAVEIADGILLEGTTQDIEPNQTLRITITDSQGAAEVFSATVQVDGRWVVDGPMDLSRLADGDLQVDALGSDIAGNIDLGTAIIHKDTVAAVTVAFDGDGALSATEIIAVTISGTTTDIEAGQLVSVTVSGSGAADIHFTATVQADGSFSSANESPASYDLSGFDDGSLNVAVSTEDIAGNPATANNSAAKDTVVNLDIDTGVNGLSVTNIRGGLLTRYAGSSDAEQGQEISLTISDGINSFVTTAEADASGNWQTALISPVGLDVTQPWTVVASVTDLAGNTATDDTPSLSFPELLILSEGALSVGSLVDTGESRLKIEIGGDPALNPSPFSFSDASRQTALAGLRSQGQGVRVELSSDGLMLQLIRDDNAVVLDASIDNASQIATITLRESIEQDVGKDILVSKILIKALQNDVAADPDPELVESPLFLVVRDNASEFLVDDNYRVVEDTVLTGNVFDNDNLGEGPLTLVAVDWNGTIYPVTFDTPAELVDLVKGTLLIDSEGQWSFSANRNQDHTGTDPSFEFDYIARDADRDIDAAHVVIDISDGAAGTVGPEDVVTAEQDYTDLGTPKVDNFVILAGSDNMDITSFAFKDETINLLDNLGLSSDGLLLSYVLSNSNKTLTASTGSGTIFVLNLSAVLDANNQDLDAIATIVWSASLDHKDSDGDVLELQFIFTANDNDGTAIAPASASLTLFDGSDPQLTVQTAAELFEADLAPGPQTTDTGVLNIDIGSDIIADVVFSDITEQPELTSNGETLIYVLEDDYTLVGYVLNTLPGNEVVRVVLDNLAVDNNDSSLNYTVTLSQALDQPNINGSDDAVLALPFKVSISDSEGDRSDATLDITVADRSSPVTNNITLAVSELPRLTTISPRDIDEDIVSITAAQDQLVAIAFDIADGERVQDSSGNNLSSNNAPIFWRDNGDGTLDAVLNNGGIIFTVTTPDSLAVEPGDSQDIPVTLQMFGSIDHTIAVTDVAEIIVPLQLIDSDGSFSTAQLSLEMVDGGLPFIETPASLAVDEALLLNSSDSDTVTIFGLQGSDPFNVINVALNTAGLTTSDDRAISLSQLDTNNWVGKAGADTVFQLTIEFSGETRFELFDAIKHPAPSGVDADQNIKALDFSVSLDDADGDSSNTVSLQVDITDDWLTAPVYDAAQKLTISEGQEVTGNVLSDDNVLTTGSFGADGGEIEEVRYNGDSYRFDDDGMGAVVADPIVISLTELGNDYGTLTLARDGSYSIQANDVFNLVGLAYPDNFVFDMIDLDGDRITDIQFDFSVADADGSISVKPKNTLEDTALVLSVKGNPGDIDNSEAVTQFRFEKASLQGGTLTLTGGNSLTEDASYYYLDALRPTGSGIPGEVEPDGDLIFTPALNSSNQTASVKLKVMMTITELFGTNEVNSNFNIKVESVADTPVWDAGGNYTVTIDEDSADNVVLPPEASLVDTDSSEQLTYKFISIDFDLTISSGDTVYKAGDLIGPAEFASITVATDPNVSGEFNFVVQAISTESENGDTATAEQTFTVEVAGVADTPTLTVRDIRGTEDVAIDLDTVLSGSLSDLDGSESLWYELSLPTGWSVTGPNVIDLGGGVYRASAEDIETGGTIFMQPKEDLSKVTEVPTISVRSVAIENTEDGVTPSLDESFSPVKTFTVKLTGVADAPAIDPGPNGSWSYNPGSGIISATTTFAEDSRIALDFAISTQDDDGSEDISLHLSGIPEGAVLTNGAGDEVFLPVFDASNSSNPVYTVTLAQMADLYIQPPQDYSGTIALALEQINTEPDGDSAAFDLTVQFVVAPVIDTAGNQLLEASGVEDKIRAINLLPALGDIDSSETLEELTLVPGFQGTLYLDGTVLTVPVSGLDLSTVAGGDLPGLLSSGRLAYQAPEDQHGNFSIDFSYRVADSNGGASAIVEQSFSGSLVIDVRAQVEQNQPSTADDTRLETAGGVLTSNGEDLDLTGQVNFFEEDLDGSETLDYILLKMPAANGWAVNFPGAVHDGQGNWLLPAPATSNGVKEQALDILAGVSITALSATAGPVIIGVEARVLDGGGDDADMIFAQLLVEFTAGSGRTSIAHTPDNIVIDIVDGQENSNATMAEHINDGLPGNGVVSDSDSADPAFMDNISFRVDAGDIPFGAGLAGDGMRILYGNDGTSIVAYIFEEPALQNLRLIGLQEDFAGDFDIPFDVIATDPSGDTIVDVQTFTFNIEPVVDELSNTSDIIDGREDRLVSLAFNAEALLGDSDTDGDRGVETLQTITYSNLQGGVLFDPFNLLTFNGGDSYTLSDPSRVDDIYYRPPQHKDGEFTIDIDFEILDTTTGNSVVSNIDTTTKSASLTFDIAPITDRASLSVPEFIRGDEDSQIDLSGLSADLIDQDGSETLSLQITGVPQGAVLYANGVQLPNNGTDGGTVVGGDLNGVATYSWSVEQSQLDDITLLPPQDFSGDIALQLVAISNEKGTTDFVTTTASFTVAVDPIADGVQLTNTVATESTLEGSPLTIALGAEVLESVNNNEVIEVSVTALDSSDNSALVKLDRIIADGTRGRFKDNGDGTFTAKVVTTVASLADFSLLTGEQAWGLLNLQVDISSVDTNTVLGSVVTDTSVANSYTMAITIEPEPDPAKLERDFDGLISSNGINIPMGLTIATINPADGEINQLQIDGLPSDFSFNHGARQGSVWLVDEADISDLELITDNPSGTDPVGDFNLVLKTIATLGDTTIESVEQSMQVKIQAAGANTLIGTVGDDSYRGGTQADTFTWSDGDEGSLLFVNRDTVHDFNRGSGSYDNMEGDTLNLAGLLTGMNIITGADADAVIDVDDSSGSTVFTLRVDGALFRNQEITLENVDKNDLFGVGGSVVSEDVFLQKLINDTTLITQ
ncbi:type I secretion C-terminal target domain-containing protein [Oceanicoccus sagamiensis]|uniref:Uncharacterized protein n=1 Tax=Oceanicoccus sagamiensis TaxID=716816 RepID=A0A1X9NH25_9GAMM|nr:type I secretion C-terminal target domain-containing protein [Oceanicoccus sagamiensis]ARN75145.1 hypothetical protein BST96_14090 [Oceanicoccus sagamiensis]